MERTLHEDEEKLKHKIDHLTSVIKELEGCAPRQVEVQNRRKELLALEAGIKDILAYAIPEYEKKGQELKKNRLTSGAHRNNSRKSPKSADNVSVY